LLPGVTILLYQRLSINADFMPIELKAQVHGFTMFSNVIPHSIRTWLARSFTTLPLLSANCALHLLLISSEQLKRIGEPRQAARFTFKPFNHWVSLLASINPDWRANSRP
jgi:hypothetical protein